MILIKLLLWPLVVLFWYDEKYGETASVVPYLILCVLSFIWFTFLVVSFMLMLL